MVIDNSVVTSADRNDSEYVTCECGCGYFVNPGRRFLNHHNSRYAGATRNAQAQALDGRFIAYYTGAADARNRRPHRGNPGDHIYTHGYNDHAGQAT